MENRNRVYDQNGTSRTAFNLAKAFAGESQARMRYLLYSEVAKKEDYPTLEWIFLETADNERGHAEIFYEYLTSGLEKTILQPPVLVPIALGDTKENLLSAASGEHEEWTKLYPKFGKEAEQEGYSEIAESFFHIAEVEKCHDARYMYLHDRLMSDTLYQMRYEVTWKCMNCGYHVTCNEAPAVCPACKHPRKYFMTVFDEAYPIKFKV